jgi:MinD-like ATPase involved in chromosome partitioning or flagellar assembly
MSGPTQGRTLVLLGAGGAAWETAALRHLGDHAAIVVLKRCVDVDDLLAAASAGQAAVAVVGLDAPGLDRAAVDHLRRHGVRPVAVLPGGAADAGRLHAARIGVHACVDEDELAALPDVVLAGDPEVPPASLDGRVVPPPGGPTDRRTEAGGEQASGARPGRVVAVWGPAGAPGRTTVAAGLAAEVARRGRRTVLVDADPYGGTVAQHLGILDEVSGLLSAARLAAAGRLADRFASVQRGLDERLSVVTGLPRADRYVEVRGGTVELLLDLARAEGEVVVDTGFSLEEEAVPDYGRPGRNRMTLAALRSADLVVVVGAADPVGLSRLARALMELREGVGARPLHVVVNRMRPTLGWGEREIAGMVEGFARPAGIHFLPDDRATADRALVAGRALAEVGDSPLGRAVAALADAVVPVPAAGRAAHRPDRSDRPDGRSDRPVRRRRAGRAHRR